MMAEDNFRDMVAADSACRARWIATREHAQQAAAELGVTLDDDALIELPSIRLAVLADHMDRERMLAEMNGLDVVQKQVRQQELKAALENGDEEALASLPRDRAARLSAARKLGLSTIPPAARSVEDEATLLRRLMTLNRTERLARAREWGLA